MIVSFFLYAMVKEAPAHHEDPIPACPSDDARTATSFPPRRNASTACTTPNAPTGAGRRRLEETRHDATRPDRSGPDDRPRLLPPLPPERLVRRGVGSRGRPQSPAEDGREPAHRVLPDDGRARGRAGRRLLAPAGTAVDGQAAWERRDHVRLPRHL